MPARHRLRGRELSPRLGSVFLLASLALAPASPAHARPVASLAAGVSPRPQSWNLPVAEPGLRCGSSPELVLDRLAAHAAWQAVAPQSLPTTQSYDHGDIAVIEDDGTMFVPSGTHVEPDEVAAARAFYRTHGDDYDYLCIYTASSVPSWLLGGHATAFEDNVHQDVQGIGIPLFDYGLDFGALTGRLHSVLELNNLSIYPSDPLQDFNVSNNSMDIIAHEAMHRWGAYVKVDSAGVGVSSLLESNRAHWQFYLDDQASELGGNQWQNNGNGSWTTAGATLRYGDLERYLMGVYTPAEVESIAVLGSPSNCQPPANYTRDHHPLAGVTCDVSPYRFTINDVISAAGPRVPDASTSQKAHRSAFILLIANGTTPTQADLDKVNNIRLLWPSYFSDASGNRATMDVTLIHHAGSMAVDADRVPDSENPAATHPVTARVSIVPGSLPLAVNPSGVQLSYGVNGGSLTTLPMTQGPPGRFTATIPPLPSASSVRYFVHALSDSTGIEGWWPAGAPAVLDTFAVGPDLTPPSVSFLSPPAEIKQGLLPYRFRARASDNLGLARVFATLSVNSGVRDTLDMTRQGSSDTFYVDVFPGALPGDRLSIDAHAVDASLAQHASASAECPYPGCGFEWGYDWIEPLDLSDGGLTSAAVTAGTLDAWGWTTQADATGRASWKCGDPGVLHYLAGVDAGLVTPPLFLTGNADLHFRHRYDLEQAGPGVAYDGAVVEMSVRGGPWTQITPTGGYPEVLSAFSGLPLPPGTAVYGGTSTGWSTNTFQEADFPVSSPDTETVQFRLRMMSDDSVGGGGWFIDDFRLVMASAPVGAPPPGALSFRFLAPEPNPSRGDVRFAAQLAEPSRITLEIFDARGRRVSLAYQGDAKAGPWLLIWAGRERARGEGWGAGLYFARFTAIGATGRSLSQSRRFVLLP